MFFNFKQIVIVAICFVQLLFTINATLSKSDKAAKESTRTTTISSNTKITPINNIDDDLTVESILADHDIVEYGQRKQFPNPTLAYVTPWNNHGYDVAKFAAQKFSLIAPVWFQLQPKKPQPSKGFSCAIFGLHDMDQGWIRSIRENNSDIRIVPRFLFDSWSPDDVQTLLTDERVQERCIKSVIGFLQRNQMDGAVIEIWIQIMSMTQGRAVSDMIHLIINFAELFHLKDLLVILPVPPPLDANNKLTGYFTAQHFNAIAQYVDFVNVMTYDFPSQTIGPVAPLDWVEACIRYVIADHPLSIARKLLMGVNFYGREQESSSSEMRAIVGRGFIEMLKTKHPELLWDDKSHEHYAHSGKYMCYYPTVTSISERLQLAQRLEVGVGIWDIGQGLDYWLNLF